MEFGGVAEDRGGVAKNEPPPFMGAGEDPNGGGDAGEGGPLPEPGGLIRFSFCRLERDQA